MEEVSIIGIDLAKRSFQVHGARADGSVAYRRKLSRGRLLSFLASQPKCTVAMEACAGAHHWGREILPLGHEVRLVPPIYVKPFVKRHKNDAADAEAITEAAQRPTMHFVEVKTEAQQAQAMLFHTRDLLVRQRTQTINALRGHLAEHGVVAPQGRARIGQLAAALEDADRGLPGTVVELGRLLLGRIDELDEKIDGLDRKLRTSARECEETARLMTIPGVGPITALAIQAFAPPMESFRRGREFSAWLGLVPRQRTTGGKPRLGGIIEDGSARPEAAPVRGGHGGRPPRGPPRRVHGSVAGRDAGAQAEEGGRGGARQQDGAEGLGAGHEKGGLPGSRCRLSGRRKERGEGRRRSREMGGAGRTNGVRANGRRDGVGKTGAMTRASEPACPIWIRSHEHHTGPRPTSAASRGRTYDSTRPDCHRLGSESALARLGASTYVIAGQLQLGSAACPWPVTTPQALGCGSGRVISPGTALKCAILGLAAAGSDQARFDARRVDSPRSSTG